MVGMVHREGCGQILVSIRGEKPRLFCSAVVVALVAPSERQMKRKREKVMACGWWLMWVDRALGNLRVVPHGCMLLGAAAVSGDAIYCWQRNKIRFAVKLESLLILGGRC